MREELYSKTFFKNLLILFLPLFLFFFGVISYLFFQQLANEKLKAKMIRESLLKEKSPIIKHALDQVYSDICFLNELPELTNYYSDQELNDSKLSYLFSSFLRNRRIYQQIKILDTLGQEQINVEFDKYTTINHPYKSLHNNSSQRYFHDLKALEPGEFYISNFDLSIEEGQIGYPFNPALRFGKQVSNRDGNARLYLLLNYFGNDMLSELRRMDEDTIQKFLLLNKKAYYLIGPNPEREWKFLFSDSLQGKFSYLYPTEWKTINRDKLTGHFNTNNGYYTFSRFNICDYFLARSTLNENLIPKPCNEWIMICYLSIAEYRNTILFPVMKRFGIALLIGILLLILFSIAFVRLRIQQLAERRQHALQYRFMNSLIHTLPTPVYYLDHTNNQFGCNEAFEEMTGKKMLEIKNMKIEKLFSNDNDSANRKIKKLGDQTIKISEVRLKFPDGTLHSMLYYKAKIIVQRRKIGMVGIFSDITEIRKADTALKESEEKLRVANRTKDRFFSLIAHDLKNPFHSIMGLAHLLRTNYASIPDSDRILIADNIYFSAENTYQLLINLLDWARLQEGKIQVKTEKVNLLSLTKDCINLAETRLKEKKLKLTCDIDFDIVASADPNMVRTIIRNLLSNSIKFTEEEGRIHISARRIMKFIEISVMDNGIGINEEDKKFLFRLDKKGSATARDGEKGTGLGLILCKDFVELNHGRIWVESSAGEGSVFYFTLPIAQNA